MSQLQIEYIDPIELKPHPDNAKVHTDKQIDRVAKSMGNTGGSVQPILIDEDSVILAGHGRWMAHKKLGDISVPVIRRAGLTSAQKRKFLLADNQTNAMTGNDFEQVAQILTNLDGEGIDIADIGFSEKEIDAFLNYEDSPDDKVDKLEDASNEAPGLRELKDGLFLHLDEYAGPYNLPPLLERGIPHIPDDFVVWMNRHRTSPLAQGQMYFHLFGRESTKGMNPDETLIGFYIDDVRFERVYTKLKENTQRFINADVWGLIMPDFTRVDGWPLPQNMWNVYRSFYCAMYWQIAGLQVIPNLVAWNLDSTEACCAPIPQNAPTVAVQMQTIQSGSRKMRSADGATGLTEDEIRTNIGLSLELTKPETLLVYGSERGLILGEEICKRQGVRFVGVANRATAATDLGSDRGF